MTRDLLSIPAWISLCALPFAQAAEWTQQGPLPTGLDVRDVQILSAEEAWVVAEGGQVAHTTDGGLSWAKQDLDTDSLWELFFVDEQNGWLVGNAIFRTTDGGGTWTKLSYVTGSLYGVYFVDPAHGWLTGSGTVHRTTDGGQTWSWVALPDFWTIHGIFFHDAQHGWVSNIDGDLYETHDGGQTWTFNHKGGANLNTVWFASATTGFAVSSDEVLKTSDGGASWQAHALPAGVWGYDTFFLDAERAWMAGEGMNVVSTDDGWLTASEQLAAGSGPRLWGVHFLDPTYGMAVGEQGRILVTGDGGSTWLQRDSGGMDVHDLAVNDVAHAWLALERGDVARTSNGGAQWTTVPVDGFSGFGAVRDVDFLPDNLTGWVAGWDEAWGGTTGRISRSDDGGRTWHSQYGEIDFFLECVEAVNSDTAFAGGLQPFSTVTMVRTQDGGQSWQPVAVGLGVFNDIEFVDASTGWAAGGRIIKTTDGGDTWSTQLLPQYSIEAMDFLDADNGWAVGWFGTVLRTVDGGQTWTDVSHPAIGTTTLLGVSMVDAQTIWITGPDGYVARTFDAGASWTQEDVGFAPGYGAGFTGVEFLDAEYGWIGGGPRVDNGGPWRRTAGDPPGFALLNERIRRGHDAKLRVTGADPGDLVVTALSVAGISPAGCTGVGAGFCLGLQPPFFTIASGAADAAGRLALDVAVPVATPFVEVHLQAVRLGPASGTIASSNTTSTQIEP